MKARNVRSKWQELIITCAMDCAVVARMQLTWYLQFYLYANGMS